MDAGLAPGIGVLADAVVADADAGADEVADGRGAAAGAGVGGGTDVGTSVALLDAAGAVDPTVSKTAAGTPRPHIT